MRGRTAWIAGALGAAGVAYRALRRRPRPAADPRADELRRRLDESKQVVDDRAEFESGETPVDQADPAPERPVRDSGPGEGERGNPDVPPSEDLEAKRAAVHERGQAAAREMRGSSGEE